MKGYTKSQIDRIGNAIIFFADRFPYLSKTKLLKLLYLTEEMSVRVYHKPMLYVDFKVWRLGPVVQDIFNDLSSEEDRYRMLSQYVRAENSKKTTYVKAKQKFSDDEFSDNDIKLLEYIATKYEKCNADQLVELTHREDGLWYKTAARNGLLEEFEAEIRNYSDVVIDLSEMLDGCDKEFYQECMEAQDFERQYN